MVDSRRPVAADVLGAAKVSITSIGAPQWRQTKVDERDWLRHRLASALAVAEARERWGSESCGWRWRAVHNGGYDGSRRAARAAGSGRMNFSAIKVIVLWRVLPWAR